MQLAAHMLVYNVNRFVKRSIESLLPYVEKLYLAYPSRPFSYNRAARDSETNPTPLAMIQPYESTGKIEIIFGDWEKEEDTRNECFRRAIDEGFDWLLTVDADEFYTPCGWEQARAYLSCSAHLGNIATVWYNFFRSSHYILIDQHGSMKAENASFALRCSKANSFSNRRQPNSARFNVLDIPCYHYGYVMTDEEMLHKLTTWSHTNDFDTMRWYRLKWLNWNESIRNLHPVRPAAWPRAIRFPFAQPAFGHDFALEHEVRPRSRRVRWEDSLRDFTSDSMEWVRRWKRWGQP